MRAVPAWVDKVHDRDKIEQCIYDLCFNPDGSQLVVAAGQRVLVYDTADGSLIQPLKGHKDTVYSVCYAKDGKRFASGSADKNVIIWTSKLDGVLKYSHNDAVQCLAYNPVSHNLASCAISDFAFWSPDQKAVQKHKSNSRINACAWTNDGQYLALGLGNGCVSIRNKLGEEKSRIEGQPSAAVWSLVWSPAKDDGDVLCVADWGQKISFYNLAGKMVSKERPLGYDPLCVSYYGKGEYLLISGMNRACSLLTKDGIKLGDIGDEQQSWVWCCAVRPDSSFVAIGCQDGTIAYYQLVFSTVHGLYKERYAFRENMTDVIIQHLLTDQKVKIKCRDLIKKIAIFKNRLAVQLPERVVVYELYSVEADSMHYRVKEKISKHLDCNLLVVCSNHLVLCQEKKLQCITFDGSLQREWLMDSPIRYIKVIGGPESQEALLLGLKDGEVCKIFLDNPFPCHLLQVSTSIRCLDMSLSRRKLAIVDDNNQCLVYDLHTQDLLFQEPNASSVAWNSHNEDVLCFSGNDTLCIKAGSFPVHQQKLSGFVVGFCGAKVFCLHVSTMAAVEVPLSTQLYQYLDKKQLRKAYNIACMGVPTGDWETLAHAALEELDFEIAKLAFMRTSDVSHLQLISDFQRRLRSGEKADDLFVADICAFRGKYKDAAQLYKRCHAEQKAVNMYTDLRMFDLAQEYLGAIDGADQTALMRKKADWARDLNEHRAAAEMYFSAGDVRSAVEIIGKHGWVDMLVDVGRRLDKANDASMVDVAGHLQRLGELSHAADIFNRLGDQRSVITVYVQAHNWAEAFALAEQHPQFKDAVYVPYSQWLAENDRFAEAQEAFHKAGHPDKAFGVLYELTLNAVKESRFQDAGYYYWVLARQCLEIAGQDPERTQEMMDKYHENDLLASIYYAYDPIQRYLDEPFMSCIAEGLFNSARFILHATRVGVSTPGVSQFAVLYALAKQARNLGAYKLAQQVLKKIHKLCIPQRFQDNVDLAYMSIKSKPYSDNEELLPMCYRCSTFNQLTSKTGNACSNCRQPFVHSFFSFEVTPLVEFQLEPDVSEEEAARLIEAPVVQQPQSNGWNQNLNDGFQTLQLDEAASNVDDLFTARLMDFENVSDECVPVTVNRAILQAMEASSVVICRWPPPLRWQFYRNILPDLQITNCNSCNRIFYLEDFESQVLQKGVCPFCRSTQFKKETRDITSTATAL